MSNETVEIKCSLGKKVFSIRCHKKDMDRIDNLGKELGKRIDKNMSIYEGLPQDNLLILAAFEMLEEIRHLTEQNKTASAGVISKLTKLSSSNASGNLFEELSYGNTVSSENKDNEKNNQDHMIFLDKLSAGLNRIAAIFNKSAA